jgi:hypothetical protein
MTRGEKGTHSEKETQNQENESKERAPQKKSRSKSKPGPKLATRLRAPKGRSAKKTTSQPATDGEGAKQLLSAVNSLVGKKSADIAKALVDGTVAGSASHARLVVDLSGAGGLASPPARSRAGRPTATTRDSGHAALTALDLPGSEENWEFDLEPEARPGYTPPTKP